MQGDDYLTSSASGRVSILELEIFGSVKIACK